MKNDPRMTYEPLKRGVPPAGYIANAIFATVPRHRLASFEVPERYGFFWLRWRTVKYIGSGTVWYRVHPKTGEWKRAPSEMEAWLSDQDAQRKAEGLER